jgi:hypothetical protein
VLLQNPVEVKGASSAGCKGAHPGQVILSDSLSLDALGVASRVRPPQGMLGSRQSPDHLPAQ